MPNYKLKYTLAETMILLTNPFAFYIPSSHFLDANLLKGLSSIKYLFRFHRPIELTIIYSVKLHTITFADLLIQQEIIRHFDNVCDEIKDIRDREEVLNVIPKLEKLLIAQLDG